MEVLPRHLLNSEGVGRQPGRHRVETGVIKYCGCCRSWMEGVGELWIDQEPLGTFQGRFWKRAWHGKTSSIGKRDMKTLLDSCIGGRAGPEEVHKGGAGKQREFGTGGSGSEGSSRRGSGQQNPSAVLSEHILDFGVAGVNAITQQQSIAVWARDWRPIQQKSVVYWGGKGVENMQTVEKPKPKQPARHRRTLFISCL